MRLNEKRHKLLAMMALLSGMLMAFTLAGAENAEIPTLNDMLARISSLVAARATAPMEKDCPGVGMNGNEAEAFSFRLPSSLRIIGDEAFESTAVVVADLSGTSVEQIGERAFASIPTLIGVRVPEKTRFIARTAFAGSEHVTLTGNPRGYTRAWAKENGIPFAPITTFTANTQNQYIAAATHHGRERLQSVLPGQSTEKDIKKPTGKTNGEITDNRCLEGTAYHIQGRAPPVREVYISAKT